MRDGGGGVCCLWSVAGFVRSASLDRVRVRAASHGERQPQRGRGAAPHEPLQGRGSHRIPASGAWTAPSPRPAAHPPPTCRPPAAPRTPCAPERAHASPGNPPLPTRVDARCAAPRATAAAPSWQDEALACRSVAGALQQGVDGAESSVRGPCAVSARPRPPRSAGRAAMCALALLPRRAAAPPTADARVPPYPPRPGPAPVVRRLHAWT